MYLGLKQIKVAEIYLSTPYSFLWSIWDRIKYKRRSNAPLVIMGGKRINYGSPRTTRSISRPMMTS